MYTNRNFAFLGCRSNGIQCDTYRQIGADFGEIEDEYSKKFDAGEQEEISRRFSRKYFRELIFMIYWPSFFLFQAQAAFSDDTLKKIEMTTNNNLASKVKTAELVIETVNENAELKKKIFQEVDANAPR